MDLIRVGGFELYPGERLLCSDGKPIDIGSRAFDLLLVLAEHPGRLVTKAALIERVWPRVIVDENNLPAQVASLRRVLGAAAIRTVPRYGYRLDLPVTRAQPAAADGAPREPEGPGALPVQPGVRRDPLVGRAADLDALREALERERLVTLVGAAGVGKSRLARELLGLEEGGGGTAAVLISLEPVVSAVHVPAAVAHALGLSLPETADRFAALGRALDGTRALVVLDGAEHLVHELADALDALVSRATGVRVLVTSQAPLGRIGEAIYRLGPLPIADAAELFGQRAMQADHRFRVDAGGESTVAEICRRLDGNPLAVELAAARVPAFGLASLLAHLDDRFRLLKRAGRVDDPRHGVLQAAFDWSYGLLAPEERRVFDRLGAFAASFTLEAAARCVADESIDLPGAVDLVGRLVDRSLVTLLPREPARYALLETARCYARSRLEADGAVQDAERRMAVAQLHVLDRAYEDYWSMDEAVWLHQHELELDNVRAALDWARRHDAALAIALYGSAWPLFVETDQHGEARAAHDEAVALLGDSLPGTRFARFWEAVATYDSERQVDRARYAAEVAARLHAAAGDSKAQCYALLQGALNGRDDPAGAGELLAAARRLEAPDWPVRLRAHAAIVEGAILASAGRVAEARAAYRRALDHAVATSERQALAAAVNVVELDIASGALADALQLARPLAISLRHSGRRETRQELLLLQCAALLLAGELEEARATGIEFYEVARRLDRGRLYRALDAMALIAAREGRARVAARVAAAAQHAHDRHGETQRRPAGERVRAEVQRLLDAALGQGWQARESANLAPLGEDEACELALGLRVEPA
jgi:predicted ATPase/DNA-binding winged helix-turn-helix (wHTH) protein